MTDTTVSFKKPLSQADISRIGGAAPNHPLLLQDPATGNIQMKAHADDTQPLLEFSGTNGKFNKLEIHMAREEFAQLMLTLEQQGDKELYTTLERAVAGTNLMPTRKERLYAKANTLLDDKHLEEAVTAYSEKVEPAVEKLNDYMDAHNIARDDELETQPDKLAALASKLPKKLVLHVKRAMMDMPAELMASAAIHTATEMKETHASSVAAADEQKLVNSTLSNSDIIAMMATNKEFAESMLKVMSEIAKPGDQSHSASVERELEKQAKLFKKTTGETLRR